MLMDNGRRMRVLIRQMLGSEPKIWRELDVPLERHGSKECGWYIPTGLLHPRSVVVDAGLGEDISFSTSIAERYDCVVHGFDPTPRAISYVERLAPRNFVLHRMGIGSKRERALFHLPNNEMHVSGSLEKMGHVGRSSIEVELIPLEDVFAAIGSDRIDLLKLDIEGAEYDVLASDDFQALAARIGILCIEFHHRWDTFGARFTADAVARLRNLGLRCAWRANETNEEFTFVNARALESRGRAS